MRSTGVTLVLAAVLFTNCIEKPDAWTPGMTDVDVASGDQRPLDGLVEVDVLPVDSGSREVNVEDVKDSIADNRVPQDADSVPEIYDSTIADEVAPIDVVEVVDIVGFDGELPTDTAIDTETTTDLDAVCAPDCDGKECGDDGCGGSCGTCAPASYCGQGSCIETGSKHFSGAHTFVPDLGVLGAKTYSFWFNVEDADTQTGQYLVIKKDTTGSFPMPRPIAIAVSQGQVGASVSWEGGPFSVAVASVGIESKKWYYVVWQVSETTAEFYLDGKFVGGMNLPGASIDNDASYTVGGAPGNKHFQSFLTGEMYNFRVSAGFLYDSGFIPCDEDTVAADSALTNFPGPVPCVCQPQCTDKQCGDDGCAETCGTCANDEPCEQGQCLPL